MRTVEYIGALALKIFDKEKLASVAFSQIVPNEMRIRCAVPHDSQIIDYNLVRDRKTITQANEFIAEADADLLLAGISRQKTDRFPSE